MKIAMLFPSYGSQFVGMSKDLYDDSRVIQEYFEEASNCLNTNFVKLCFASSDAELGRLENALPALFLVSSAHAALLKEQGIEPAVVAGYNLGEISAIHAASGLSFPDGLYLLSKLANFYSGLLDEIDVAGLKLSNVTHSKVKKICIEASDSDDRAYIAIHNLPNEFIIMGDYEAIENARDIAEEDEDIDIDDAPVELGLHSSLMDPVVANFKMYVEKVDFKDIAIPLINNTNGALISEGAMIKNAVIKHIHSTILFTDVLETLQDYDLIIEVGPGSALKKLVNDVYPDKIVFSIDKKADIDEVKNYIEQTKL